MSEIALAVGVYATFIVVIGFAFTWSPRPPNCRIYKWPIQFFVFGVTFMLLGWLLS